MSTQPTVLYRYSDHQGVVRLEAHRVEKRTPKGCWIGHKYSTQKPTFILNGARKRFAYPTEEEAKESFLARKRHQLGHLKRQTKNVEIAVKAMTEGRLNDTNHLHYAELDEFEFW